MDLYLLMLLLAALLFTTSLASQSEQTENNVFAAGRSEAEFNYVKSKIQEIEQIVIRNLRGTDKKIKDVAYKIDKKSEAYKNMLLGAIDDILLTAADADDWLAAVKGRRKRKIYNFDRYPEKKWTMPIKFIIDNETIVNSTSRGIIRDAIAAWERETCVKFQEVWSEPKEKYLFFTNIKGGGCKSFVGKTSYSDLTVEEPALVRGHYYRQPVFLEDPGCYLLGGTPMHEIGHALGLYHEAQRLDRDDYIQILTWNIKIGEKSNFIKPLYTKIETKGVPYDLGSLMQYGALEFSKDVDGDKYVIIPYETKKLRVMGQSVEIGFYDAKIINAVYCPASTGQRLYARKCLNHGYQPSNSVNCRCPAQWTGQYCEKLSSSSPGCSVPGGEITHTAADTDKTFSLYSPNYKNYTRNGTFTPGDHCFWKIQVPISYQIIWWIDVSDRHDKISNTFGLTESATYACIDWLEIRKPAEFRGIRMCGWGNSSDSLSPLYSGSHILHIDFRSFKNNLLAQNYSSFYRGFHLKYQLKPASARQPTTTTTSNYDNIWNIVTTKRNWWETTKSTTTDDPIWNIWTTKKTVPYYWPWDQSTTTTTEPYFDYPSTDNNGVGLPIGITVGSITLFVFFIGAVCGIYNRKKAATLVTVNDPSIATASQNRGNSNVSTITNPSGACNVQVRRQITQIRPGLFQVTTSVIGQVEPNRDPVRPNVEPVQPPPYTVPVPPPNYEAHNNTATSPEFTQGMRPNGTSEILSVPTENGLLPPVVPQSLLAGQTSSNCNETTAAVCNPNATAPSLLPDGTGYTSPSIGDVAVVAVTDDADIPKPPMYTSASRERQYQEENDSHIGVHTHGADGSNIQGSSDGILERLKNIMVSDKEVPYQRFDNEI